MVEKEEYLDTYEAATELGISRVTLLRLVKAFGVKRYKIPGKRRTLWKRSDLAVLRQPQPQDEMPRGKAAA